MSNTDRPRILVLGRTGNGKSTFTNCVTGRETAVVGETWKSCTETIKDHEFEVDGRSGVIIDTPGFDDAEKSDTDILITVANYLKATYENNFKLTALFYLIDISGSRLTGSERQHLKLFKSLCGQENLKNVIFITTKWDEVSAEKGERGEETLKEHLTEEIKSGARIIRHDNSRTSAERIVRTVLKEMVPTTTKIQREMVDENKDLKDTEAGQSLDEATQKRIKNLQEEIDQLKKQQDEALRQQAEEKRIEMEKLKEQNEKLKEASSPAGSSLAEVCSNVLKVVLTESAKHAVQYSFSKFSSGHSDQQSSSPANLGVFDASDARLPDGISVPFWPEEILDYLK